MKRNTYLLFFVFIFALCITSLVCKKDDSSKEGSKDQVKVEDESVKAADTAVEAEATANPKSAMAVKLVDSAIEYAEKNGIEKTLDAIHNPSNPDYKKFISGEYYLWVFSTNFKDSAVVVAHAVNKALKGKEWFDAKDPDGKLFFQEIIRIAKDKGKGWISYRWAHPRLKRAMIKLTYFRKHKDLVFNCGYYK